MPSPLRPAWLNPPVEPLATPQLHPLMLVVPALAAVPVVAAPGPTRTHAARPHPTRPHRIEEPA